MFVLGFIYLLMSICGNLMLERLVDLISAHFGFNGSLYFSSKNLF